MNATAEKTMVKEEVVEVDIIVQTAKEIGSLDKQTAFEIVPSLIDSVGFSNFKLGGVLSTIKENGWWESDGGKFKDFVQDNFGIHYRKAQYLINIYDDLVEADTKVDCNLRCNICDRESVSGDESPPREFAIEQSHGLVDA